MEKHEITAPPKVMWGVDDEIRDLIKSVLKDLGSDDNDVDTESIGRLINQVKESYNFV